jgi:anti-sigma regulatory factor (Ser/Thr protein kinase)
MTEGRAQTASRDFPGTLEAAADAETWLSSQSGALGLHHETVFAISLCVEELFLNAVQHGQAKRATISIWTEPDGPRLEFIDDGRAFDPTIAPPKHLHGPGVDFEIGGFGTGLVQKFSRRMSYMRADGANRLVLEFDPGHNGKADSGTP